MSLTAWQCEIQRQNELKWCNAHNKFSKKPVKWFKNYKAGTNLWLILQVCQYVVYRRNAKSLKWFNSYYECVSCKTCLSLTILLKAFWHQTFSLQGHCWKSFTKKTYKFSAHLSAPQSWTSSMLCTWTSHASIKTQVTSTNAQFYNLT